MVNSNLKEMMMNSSTRIWTRSIGFLTMAFISFSAIFSRDGLGLAGDDPAMLTLSAMGSGLVNGLNIIGILGVIIVGLILWISSEGDKDYAKQVVDQMVEKYGPIDAAKSIAFPKMQFIFLTIPYWLLLTMSGWLFTVVIWVVFNIVLQTWTYKQREYFNKTYLKTGGNDEKDIASDKLNSNPLA